MEKQIMIYFDKPKAFSPSSIDSLDGIAGVYFIFNKSIRINYPFDASKLIYIGMSERKTNSIASRLMGHFDGKSKNVGLINYRKNEDLLFTYINYEILENIWNYRIEDLESYFINNFVEHFGVYPICNNRTGLDMPNNKLTTKFKIDWNYFK